MRTTELPPAPDLLFSTGDEVNKYFSSPEAAALVAKANREYHYWTEFKRQRIPEGLKPDLLWSWVKMSRRVAAKTILISPQEDFKFYYQVTNSTLQKLHLFDLYLGGNLQGAAKIAPEDKDRYLISSIMEEAIASSQLEGASTTREKAKEMLREERKPRNKSERMIANNYHTIRRIMELKQEKLTPELLLELHALISKDTLNSPDYEGRFRNNNDITVQDYTTGEVVYYPPDAKRLTSLIQALCNFTNASDEKEFVHPIIKASILHFLIGYIHPFVDGNGRTARALFYWYMISRGYWLLEYLSISRVIIKSAAQYARAYLYTEQDGNDLTYFINYQVKTLDQAFQELQQYIGRKIKERQELFSLKTISQLNDRQMQLVQQLAKEPEHIFSIKEVQNIFGTVYQTARTDLKQLEETGLLRMKMSGKKQLYYRSPEFDQKLENLLRSK